MQSNIIYLKKWKSPIADLYIYANETHLLGLLFEGDSDQFLKHFKNSKVVNSSSTIIDETIIQLKEYFNGDRKSFDLKINLAGTEFQKKVWSELKRIPYGKTITYKDQAERLKSANAVRAVGSANGKNPIAIVVPCHRVIGSNGKLVGYAGGQQIKSALLKIEGLNIPVDMK